MVDGGGLENLIGRYAKHLTEELHEAYPERTAVDLMLEQLQIFDPAAAWTDSIVRKWLDDKNAASEAATINREL